jgi:hypothetical protein
MADGTFKTAIIKFFDEVGTVSLVSMSKKIVLTATCASLKSVIYVVNVTVCTSRGK